ncbi:MAG: indole-3-glycerol phosphate synthase [Candidatus Omnitrophica bacterium CG11_big_fil_rev_8_21_14_0_20_45_26]|uniref:Indole-3-glycerol phosphate synthase n=1 Tax=Candidatus Abzuiibacterium crystallinum TaxID=1974748 RepID=A0A2H0LS65_9BACT|nr:MAG: indole-3-glycerol phosphate synthase [Candidatus Omnitrophica bacterium CG11_big_fil_rev_8_21_14_0_20_45_26]PIW65018.1 MAG: indole-3-glycerol phosphate synthase [Candidatus Omnitrophica bacterium CG12_big_fil_rev_8_21_14_0_65_45_16]
MILDQIVNKKKNQVVEAKNLYPLQKLKRALLTHKVSVRSLKSVLQNRESRPHLICEMKKSSPSEGMLKHRYVPQHLLRQFEKGGAAAVSILTEPHYFSGSIEHVRRLRPLSKIPILRKDFIIDEYQIYESRLIGADIILLIAAILTPAQMSDFLKLARTLGLEVLTEIHREDELQMVIDAGSDLIGINNRNLDTLQTDVNYAKQLLEKVPKNLLAVVESGISSHNDIQTYQERADGFLIGSTLMKSTNILEKLRELRGC